MSARLQAHVRLTARGCQIDYRDMSDFESLPRIYREVFVLRDVEELSIREAAQVLGIREVNVKTRLSRARIKMRELLAGTLGARERCVVFGNTGSADCR